MIEIRSVKLFYWSGKRDKRAKSPQFIFGVPAKDVYVLDVKRKPNSGFLGRMIQFVDTH